MALVIIAWFFTWCSLLVCISESYGVIRDADDNTCCEECNENKNISSDE